MLKFSKRLLFILAATVLLIVTVYFIWQKYKYRIANNALKATVKEQTDSLYSIKYDSLSFDAATGHATMKNIRIVPDTGRIKNMDVENMPDILLDITIKSVEVTGVQTAKALSGNKIEGDSVILNAPQIILYSLKPLQKKTVFQNEANDLYRQILGKLDLIKVGFVFVNNVHVKGIDFFTKRNNFELINGKFVLEDILIDSTHNSDTGRILFSKQAAFTVDSFISFNHDRRQLTVNQVHFLGAQKKLFFSEIMVNRFANDTSAGIKLLEAKNLALNGVNTNEIVKNKNLFVDTIVCEDIVLYQLPLKNLKADAGKPAKNPDSTGFENVYSVALQHLDFPKLTFVPFKESNFSVGNISIKVNQVVADKIAQIESHPLNYTKEVAVNVDLLSLGSKDKTYRYNFNDITINSLQKSLYIHSFFVIPFASERNFANSFHFQKDRYDVALTGLSLKNINVNSLMDKKLEAAELLIDNASVKIYRDLHKPLEHKSRVGKYPSQMLVQLPQPIHISKVKVKNAFVEYRENENVTDSIGDLKFTNANFNISNVTNMPEAIQKNSEMNMTFNATALDAFSLKGNFKFLLGNNNGDFFANGHISGFDASVLNKVSIPMALVKINSGKISSIDFRFRGNDTISQGNFLMNYEGMKIDILKRDKETKKIKKRGLLSLAANLVVNNKSTGTMVHPKTGRDIYKSFFNLVWKTLFAGMKETLGVPESVGK